MAYWLIKSDPETYSWDDLIQDSFTDWDGVRNYQARNNLRIMKKGDLVLFYHSQIERAIIGIVKISKESFQDKTTSDEKWVAVEIKPLKKLKTPVSLELIKKTEELSNIALIKQSRLSVMPITDKEYNIILSMGK